jgi:hypothetical protein
MSERRDTKMEVKFAGYRGKSQCRNNLSGSDEPSVGQAFARDFVFKNLVDPRGVEPLTF